MSIGGDEKGKKEEKMPKRKKKEEELWDCPMCGASGTVSVDSDGLVCSECGEEMEGLEKIEVVLPPIALLHLEEVE